VKRTDQKDYVIFKQGTGCSSFVGRSGGEQVITLGDRCLLGQTIHEMAHALGLWHEQGRSDRDDFIEIVWDNIKPEERFNFDQHLNDGKDIGEYDYGSIMHYGPKDFSKNGEPTIKAKQELADGFGQRKGLSAKDIAAINELY
jgi:hypothetical protein